MKATLKQLYTRLCRRVIQTQSLEKKLCYLYSFPHNNNGWLDTLVEKASFPISIAYTAQVEEEVATFCQRHPHVAMYPLKPSGRFFSETLKVIGSSQWLLCDNYFPVLASLTNPAQHVGMVWHANGAIKLFGAMDPKNKERTPRDVERLYDVYHHYTDYFIPSKAMGEIFKESYFATDERLHPTGFPRTDMLCHDNVEEEKRAFFEAYPQYQGKKIVLYAPTYRENQDAVYPFDKEKIEALDNMAVICRYHPHSHQSSDLPSVDYATLLAVADYCITDYSSLPFDYTLLHQTGRFIFYQYDQDSYQARFGLEPRFMDHLPGPVVKTMDALIEALRMEETDFTAFNREWNTYNKGNATDKLLALIEEDLK